MEQTINNKISFTKYIREKSARKNAEKIAEQKSFELYTALQKANAANVAKTQFLSSVSHEIRTPLNAIIGFTQIMKIDLDNKELLKEKFELVLANSWYLLNLVNNIIDLSIIEDGEIELEPSSFSIGKMLDEIYNKLHPRSFEKNIELKIENSIDRGLFINSDESKLKTIIYNLIDNAIKFTSEGNVTVKSEFLKLKKEQMLLRFEVIDTGIGISSYEQKHIFEKFYRSKNGLNNIIEGCGIGLSLCKSYSDLFEGKIKLESRENQGAIFTLEIPISENDISSQIHC